jgi:hypothetical protein
MKPLLAMALSVLFRSGIAEISSDHQARDGGAVLLAHAGKTGAYRLDLTNYHGRTYESNPKAWGRRSYPDR